MRITKKQLYIMYITILLLIMLSNIFGATITNFPETTAKTTANVNFRKQANLNSSSIMQVIKNNSEVKVIGTLQDFYIALLSNNQIGLLSKQYVKLGSINKYRTYISLNMYDAYIKGSNTNIRGGPSTSYIVTTKLQTNNTVKVLGKINDFYVVVTPSNYVGMVRSDLITKTKTTTTNTNTTNNTNNITNITTSNSDKDLILSLINNARKNNNIAELTLNKALSNVAQIKADDMVENNYFSHTSPRYSNIFSMMQGFGIKYTTAGENIAGNPNITNAVTSWLESTTHRKNLLNSSFNNIGIGVTKSPTYGNIIVVLFTQT